MQPEQKWTLQKVPQTRWSCENFLLKGIDATSSHEFKQTPVKLMEQNSLGTTHSYKNTCCLWEPGMQGAGDRQGMTMTVGSTFLLSPYVYLQASATTTTRITVLGLTNHCSDLIYSCITVIKIWVEWLLLLYIFHRVHSERDKQKILKHLTAYLSTLKHVSRWRPS